MILREVAGESTAIGQLKQVEQALDASARAVNKNTLDLDQGSLDGATFSLSLRSLELWDQTVDQLRKEASTSLVLGLEAVSRQGFTDLHPRLSHLNEEIDLMVGDTLEQLQKAE